MRVIAWLVAVMLSSHNFAVGSCMYDDTYYVTNNVIVLLLETSNIALSILICILLLSFPDALDNDMQELLQTNPVAESPKMKLRPPWFEIGPLCGEVPISARNQSINQSINQSKYISNT